MRLGLTGLAAVMGAMLAVSSVNAAPLATFDGSPTGGVTPQNGVYQQYSYQFVATSSSTLLSFLFRNDPSFSSIDDISVALAAGGPELVTNGGLEAGPAPGTFWPVNWVTIGTQGLPAAGVWSNSVSSVPFAPHGGAGYWVDGAVGGYDGLAQALATASGETYILSFWYASTPIPDNGSVGFIVSAGELPPGQEVTGGSLDVPEPASMALLGGALVAFGALRRRRAR